MGDNATIQHTDKVVNINKNRWEGDGSPREVEDIIMPYQEEIEVTFFDSDGCLGPAGGSEHPIDIASLGFMRYRLESNPDIKVAYCTGRPVAYVIAMAQMLNTFGMLEGKYQEALHRNTGLFFKGYPCVCENGAVLFDPVAKRAYPSPLMTEEQIESINKIKVEVIPGLCKRTGMRQEAAAKQYCISLNPAPGQSIEEAWEVTCEQLKDYGDMLDIKHSCSALDLTPKGISKASSVVYILKNMEINPLNVLGVGDSSGDWEWLQVVGSAAIPSNGRKALMKLPNLRYVSTYAEAAGALDIVESVIDNNAFHKEYRKAA